MNIEEYINTIHSQIQKILDEGGLSPHLCLYKGIVSVREGQHYVQDNTRTNPHVLIHQFTKEEVEKGLTSKTWDLIKQAIALLDVKSLGAS